MINFYVFLLFAVILQVIISINYGCALGFITYLGLVIIYFMFKAIIENNCK